MTMSQTIVNSFRDYSYNFAGMLIILAVFFIIFYSILLLYITLKCSLFFYMIHIRIKNASGTNTLPVAIRRAQLRTVFERMAKEHILVDINIL